MMGRLLLLITTFGVLAQGNPPLPNWNNLAALTPTEKGQLEKELKIDNRIRIYESASDRILRSIQIDARTKEFATVPDRLKSWSEFLTVARKDIEDRMYRNKKSKALIRFEIRLRKAIADIKQLKIQSPAEQQQDFDTWLAQAEDVRKKCVDILFHL